jgi:hypothetical protein
MEKGEKKGIAGRQKCTKCTFWRFQMEGKHGFEVARGEKYILYDLEEGKSAKR